MKTYEPCAGEPIGETAQRMVAMAKKSRQPVQAVFNDVRLTARPGDTPDAIEEYYSKEVNRRHEEYVNSPEYKKWQCEAEEAQRRHDLALQEALAAAPPITLRDKESWKQTVARNSDFYGGGVIRFAERWARLMEARMAKGDMLEACAEEAAHLADNNGITGFMYGCAVTVLVKVWIHGEKLRRWHNLKYQIGNEGEKANKNGEVLNPAVLVIGK